MSRPASMWLVAMAALGSPLDADAIPPPPEQFASNCESPTFASDVVVCDDEELIGLDRRLWELYGRLHEALEPDGTGAILDDAALVESQDAWFRRRSLCAFSAQHRACLAAAYRERLQVLEALDVYLGPPPTEVLRGVCRSAPWGPVGVRLSATQLGQILVSDDGGRLLAIAIGDGPQDDWTPYLRHEAEGSQLRLFPLEGPVVTCELRQPN